MICFLWTKILQKTSDKLGNSKTAPKTYWSVENPFDVEKPLISPLFVNFKHVSNFPRKIESNRL